ncbi:MAG: NAD(P)-dependent glycerol-3-phosphate dehydrogenase [Planctomycetes bacterium]|nr:NAD(P)-dependent glycerol-3-phosphate dehydrogenase [Planctomycetota bacterium]
MAEVLIIGAGSWGTAVGVLLAGAGNRVSLYERLPDYAAELAKTRVNRIFLPGIAFPAGLDATNELNDLTRFDWCISAVPTRFVRGEFSSIAARYPAELPLVSLSKGIEQETVKFPTQILAEVTPAKHLLCLSGPSHAEEVARGLPAVVVSAGDESRAQALAELVSTPSFRVYYSTDLAGVELSGAAKNVVAIAAGIVDGLQLGDNAKAALIARGLAEIVRLGVAMGANERTFSGLSGIGDLYTTCASSHGRNLKFGRRIGAGEKPEEIIASMEMVVEGYNTARALRELSRQKGIEMPICEEVCNVIYDNADPREAVTRLMTRSLKAE